MSWASISPSQRVVWRPLEAIWRCLDVCSRPLGAMAGKADAIPSRGRRETGGIPTTAMATRGLGVGGFGRAGIGAADKQRALAEEGERESFVDGGEGLRLAWWAGIELLGLVGWNGYFRPC
jgi:ferric-dicitrate binding protein FerR (iron transport regulator)